MSGDTLEELAFVWVDGGIVHIGDEELAWDLTPEQAREWAKGLAVAASEAEE